MSTNKYLPHLVVVPEDEANRQMMTGFINHYGVDSRKVHIEPVAGGWEKVPEHFTKYLAATMKKLKDRHVLLLFDFDQKGEDRFATIEDQIPEELRDRVFLLGTSIEPEKFSSEMGRSLETLGTELAGECLAERIDLWNSEHLKHNLPELQRMKPVICHKLSSK